MDCPVVGCSQISLSGSIEFIERQCRARVFDFGLELRADGLKDAFDQSAGLGFSGRPMQLVNL
jgi:hypothetical protein